MPPTAIRPTSDRATVVATAPLLLLNNPRMEQNMTSRSLARSAARTGSGRAARCLHRLDGFYLALAIALDGLGAVLATVAWLRRALRIDRIRLDGQIGRASSRERVCQ